MLGRLAATGALKPVCRIFSQGSQVLVRVCCHTSKRNISFKLTSSHISEVIELQICYQKFSAGRFIKFGAWQVDLVSSKINCYIPSFWIDAQLNTKLESTQLIYQTTNLKQFWNRRSTAASRGTTGGRPTLCILFVEMTSLGTTMNQQQIDSEPKTGLHS